MSSYAIGPIDPIQLTILQTRLSNGQEISLLLPVHLPLSLSTDPLFKDGYETGYLYSDAEEEWTVPQMVNHIYGSIRHELYEDWNEKGCTWVTGFLLGLLTSLAETRRTLALVGLAHICFLFTCLPFGAWPPFPYENLVHMEGLHRDALDAYRARVRKSREQGMSFYEAQRAALGGGLSL